MAGNYYIRHRPQSQAGDHDMGSIMFFKEMINGRVYMFTDKVTAMPLKPAVQSIRLNTW